MAIKPREIKLKDGTIHYRFVAFYKSPLTGRRRKVSVTKDKLTSRTENAAHRELDEIIRQRLAIEGNNIIDISLGELAEKFFVERAQQLKQNTLSNEKIFVRQFVDYLGSHTLVTKISTPMINKYFRDRLYSDKPISNSTAHDIKGHLVALFKYAINYGYLTASPMETVEIPWKRAIPYAKKIENKYLTREESSALINEFKRRKLYHYSDAFRLQYLTGLRFGELAALQVKNVLEKDGQRFLQINSTLTILKSPIRRFISDSPKTSASNRNVVLSPEASEIVKRHCVGKDAEALLFSYNDATHFTDQRPLDITAANSALRRAAKRLGIDKPVTTHFFRHTHVSLLADLGVPLRVIQKRVGHSKSDITREIYLHVTTDTQQKYDQLISKLEDM